MDKREQEIQKWLAAHKRWRNGRRKTSPKAPADLREADLRGAYLQGANLRGAYLRGANLGEAYLREADLREADLQGANLRGAYLGEANLRGANLLGAYLGEANLRGANLLGANLQGAYLRGAIYTLFQVLSVTWANVSARLTTEMMKWDASACPHPEKFERWSTGGECPLDRIGRILDFPEKRTLFEPGKPDMTLWELWVALAKENGITI